MTKFITNFKTKATAKAITSQDIVLLCLCKAHASKAEDKAELARALMKRSFSPITKPVKLVNGAEPYQALNHARSWVAYYLHNKNYGFFNIQETEELSALMVQVGKF